MKGLSLRRGPSPLLVGGCALVAAVMSVILVRSPVLAVLAIGAIGVGVAATRFGLVALVVPSFGLLPWLVILEGKLPNEVGTLTATMAAGALLVMAAPLRWESLLIPVASFVWVTIVLSHGFFATDFEGVIQACKYMVFPAMALAVTSEGGREVLPRLRKPVLGSALAAMAFHLAIIAAGLGADGTYYGAGEKLGFAGKGPHPLALMSMIIACAGLASPRVRERIAFFALGAVPAALSGVRSALLGLAVALGVYIWRTPRKVQVVAVLIGIFAVALATGALDVVGARFGTHPEEFSSFSSAGSGRGEIWTVALEAWEAAGPWAWAFGTGLRTIPHFELKSLGIELIGHSDIIEVMVQLGVIGFAAWASIWVGLLRARLQPLVLIPIVVFGVVNGSLEYVAPLTLGIFLAGACVDLPPERST
ncbi:MAG TPA: O-antigen ligase family protein [Solirubrobacterales bacterium]|nr:O-antigen ligase family protein [Solirubrobacterales bacterium]